jgi:hypothetical protein
MGLERQGVGAVRVIAAANEASVLGQLQAQAAAATGRALPGILVALTLLQQSGRAQDRASQLDTCKCPVLRIRARGGPQACE